MKQFLKLRSSCLPIREENIDTDQIVPARFLKITTREGFGQYMFYDWRFDSSGKAKAESIFHNLTYKRAKVLIAGNNFGCGSSREHAPWALLDYGFRVVISSSFGDIFYNNSLKNGLLPITVSQKELEVLFLLVEKSPSMEFIVDLERQEVKGEHFMVHFDIDAFRKKCLLKGVDELGYIFSFEKQIEDYEKKHSSFAR